jgi:hypothetical protein
MTTTPEIPHKIAELILQHVPKRDHFKLLLICKPWAQSFAAALFHSPPLTHPDAFEILLSILNSSYFDYKSLIQRLELSGAAADNIYMGDLDLCLKECTNLKSFKLERCFHISNLVIQSIAKHCQNLEEVSYNRHFLLE